MLASLNNQMNSEEHPDLADLNEILKKKLEKLPSGMIDPSLVQGFVTDALQEIYKQKQSTEIREDDLDLTSNAAVPQDHSSNMLQRIN